MTATALVRDRAILIAYITMALWGFALYAVGPSMASLRVDLGVSRTQIATVGTALAAGSLLGALLARMVVVRAGQRAGVVASVAVIGVGMAGLAFAGSLAVALAGAFVVGIGGSLTTIVVPVLIETRQPAARAAALSEVNFMAAAVGALSPFVIGAAITLQLGWRWGVAVAVLAAAVALPVVARLPAAGHDAASAAAEATARPDRFGGGFLRWLAALVLGVSVEFCVSFWAADYMRSVVGMSDGAASASLTLFVAGIALGRLAGAGLSRRHHPHLLVAWAFCIAVVGAVVFWAWAAPVGSLVGLTLMGCGISVSYPLSFSLALSHTPAGRSASASTWISMSAASATLVVPFILGALGDAVGPRPAFALVPALAASAALLAAVGVAGARARLDATNC